MRLSKFVAVLAALALMLTVPAGSTEVGKWIVLYKNNASLRSASSNVVALGGRVTREYRLIPGQAIELSAAGVDALRKNPNVVSVEPDRMMYALGTVSGTAPAFVGEAQAVPYGINMVRAPQAWATTRGGGVKVAVLDTGINLSHPDRGNIGLSKSFIANEDVEDRVSGHGTHTSGTVGAADNDIGVVGVCPDCTLLIGKVLSNAGSGPISGIVAGMDWAVANGAKVISMSLGSTASSSALEAAVNNATAAGVLVVAAAGNNNVSSPHYPAFYANALAVGSVDEAKARSSFSNYGAWVDIAGPGSDVLSTVPVGTGSSANGRWSSTDHAANGVAGASNGTRTAEIVDCGLGKPENFPAGMSGKIAHIRRGEISFKDKVLNAQSAGAAGVILSNNVAGNFNGTLGDGVTSTVVAVSVSMEDGATIPTGGSGTVSVVVDDYAKFSGTSMATPHVAGVAALVIAAVSTGTPSVGTVRNALLSTADPITTDQPIGALVNAEDAVDAVH